MKKNTQPDPFRPLAHCGPRWAPWARGVRPPLFTRSMSTPAAPPRRRPPATLLALRLTPLAAAAAIHVATLAGVAHVLPALFSEGGFWLWLADAIAAIAVASTAMHAVLAATTPLPLPKETALAANSAQHGTQQCSACHAPRSSTHRHCSACRACVPRTARHCAFVGVCVPPHGRRARHFVLALAWLSVASVLAVAVCVATLFTRRHDVARVVARAAAPPPPPRLFGKPQPRPSTVDIASTVLIDGPPWIAACVCLLGAAAAALAGVAAAIADTPLPPGGWRAGAGRLFGGGSVASWLLPPWGADRDE